MEEALAYNYNVKIETSTKQLILEMIKGIRSVVPAGPEMAPDQQIEEMQPDALLDYVAKVIHLAENNPDILAGIFNINELKRYLRYSQDYLEITGKLQELLQVMRQYQGMTNLFVVRMANLVREHMDMVSPREMTSAERTMLSVVHSNFVDPFPLKDAGLRVTE
jgi:hypothetical protein